MWLCRFTLITPFYAILPLRKYFARETLLTACDVSDELTPLGVKLSHEMHTCTKALTPREYPRFAAELKYFTHYLQNYCYD
ncbi:Uncharacterised protein [Corynebacterium minutissimum]|uniref:Uncharacterized protein n=1 Tax=Corynebacterium minutissimum TaxID=38301 RepID=A0A2X4RFC8_9CORY|nr:Uncharacterised protein [Corynebacterium minutissimum]VEG04986.1 Uncharacterised protein [Corynebacterium minutissimum]